MLRTSNIDPGLIAEFESAASTFGYTSIRVQTRRGETLYTAKVTSGETGSVDPGTASQFEAAAALHGYTSISTRTRKGQTSYTAKVTAPDVPTPTPTDPPATPTSAPTATPTQEPTQPPATSTPTATPDPTEPPPTPTEPPPTPTPTVPPPTPTPTTEPTATPPGPGSAVTGITLAGPEFGEWNLPGTYGTDYIYPSATDIAQYEGQIDLIRLPFRWERIQPDKTQPLNAAEVARIRSVLDAAVANDMQVLLDMHNFGRYYGWIIGADNELGLYYADAWREIALEFGDHSGLWGYGLMNEPHDMGGHSWRDTAQLAVDAIRTVDTNTRITVPGDQWGGAWSWQIYNSNLHIADPSNLIVYEAHQYFDDNHSGAYNQSYAGEGAYPDVGVDRLQPFLTWLTAHGYQGMIGEFGAPDTAEWNEVSERFAASAADAGMPVIIWAGGPWWGNYQLYVGPNHPMMQWLAAH